MMFNSSISTTWPSSQSRRLTDYDALLVLIYGPVRLDMIVSEDLVNYTGK